jgi:hypothetical protein
MNSFASQVTELISLLTPDALRWLEPRSGAAVEILSRVAGRRLPFLVCGNGGSAGPRTRGTSRANSSASFCASGAR